MAFSVSPFAPNAVINGSVGHVIVTCSVSFEGAEHWHTTKSVQTTQ